MSQVRIGAVLQQKLEKPQVTRYRQQSDQRAVGRVALEVRIRPMLEQQLNQLGVARSEPPIVWAEVRHANCIEEGRHVILGSGIGVDPLRQEFADPWDVIALDGAPQLIVAQGHARKKGDPRYQHETPANAPHHSITSHPRPMSLSYCVPHHHTRT